MRRLFGQSAGEQDGEWISVSDLMAGLMVIFLFIAIALLRPLAEERDRAIEEKKELAAIRESIREIAVTWSESEVRIYEALNEEFKNDLKRWNAEIERETLVIRFKFQAPEVLFDQAEHDIKPRFRAILSEFFPRYVKVLRQFQHSIEELRIEGHTSSEWDSITTPEKAYFRNMGLSQARTRAVLEFVLTLPELDISGDRTWVQPLLTANGLSSSQLIMDANGEEDRSASRRVEFRVRTRVRSEIVKILEEVQ